MSELPYELLVRWSDQGALQGAHYKWRDVVVSNGVAVASSGYNTRPVELGDDLDGLLNEVAQQALEENEELRTQVETLTEEAAALRARLAEAESIQARTIAALTDDERARVLEALR